jgi:hypothetical protein
VSRLNNVVEITSKFERKIGKLLQNRGDLAIQCNSRDKYKMGG